MELAVQKRTSGKKSEINRIRREGNIPAILYSKGKQGEEVIIDGIAFRKVLNQIEPGTLSTHVLTLKNEKNKARVLVKDIQYHVTTYDILHLDFLEIDDAVLTVNVPIRFANALECEGVKLGGALREVVRSVKVRCLPKDLPKHFEIDVRELQIGQAVKLNAIEFPKGVRPLADLNQVAVVIAKR